MDTEIDNEATYIEADYTKKFFLSVHHEPENEIITTAGSGYTAADYAAMYRHVVLRLKADGVTNAIWTMDYITRIDSTPQSLAAYKALAQSPLYNTPLP